MQTIDCLQEKVQHEDLSSYFTDLNHVHYCELTNNIENEYLQEVFASAEETILTSSKIIIVNKFNQDNTDSVLEESFLIQDVSFELCTIVGSRMLGGDKHHDRLIISRHGGPFFSKWWLDERFQNQPIQIDLLPDNLPYNDNYTLVCVQVEDIDIETMCNKFLTSLGGQINVQFAKHHLPLIMSMDRKDECACGKKNYYRCCEFNCDVFLCKRCFEDKSQNTTMYIPSPSVSQQATANDQIEDNDSTNSSSSDDNDSCELINPYDPNE
jgi:hypothetical protein